MKVIKKGRIKKNPETKLTCHKCTAVVLCEKEELEYVSDFRDGDFYWFKCPECGNRQTVSADLIK